MKQAFRIEAFHITPDANEIRGPEGPVRLNPKAMQVLTRLAEQAGQVVTKQELIDGVWEGMHVGDEVLTNAVYELRKAFGDKARHPRFIQTVHRSGYRLLPSVHRDSDASSTGTVSQHAISPDGASPDGVATLGASAAAASQEDDAAGSDPGPPRRRRPTLRGFAITLMIIALAGLGGWHYWIRPWLCRQPTRVQVIDRLQSEDSAMAEAFLRLTLKRTGAFEVLDADRPIGDDVLRFRLVTGPDGLPQAEAYQDSKAIFLGLELAEKSVAEIELSRRVRELAATQCCLEGGEKERYLESGAMSIDLWRRIREADRLRRQRRLLPAAEILSDVLKVDDGDVYALERYAHLNQIRGLDAEAREQTQRALDNARKRGLGRRPLLERRQAELAGHPKRSKQLLNACLEEGGDEGRRVGCLRKLAWHLNTYDRRCRRALGTYDEIKKDTERFRREPELYLYQAEFALACGEVDEARSSIEAFERLEGQRSRGDAYAMWAWLELPTGRYEDTLKRLDLLKLSGDFRSRAMYYQAEIHRRRLACDDAEDLFLRLLASEHVSERRDALDGLFQLSYECDRPVPGEARLELLGDGDVAKRPFYAPQAWAFHTLSASPPRQGLEAMEAMAGTADLVDPVVCSPDEEERPNRLYEEWFCLAQAAVATAEGRHDQARHIHRHIEYRLMPIDKALFRFHAGDAARRAGDRDGAEALLCRALAWNPNHLQSLVALGDLFLDDDRRGGAKLAFDRAKNSLEGNDGSPLAERILATNERLRDESSDETLCGDPFQASSR